MEPRALLVSERGKGGCVLITHICRERERVDVDTTEVSIQVIQLYLEEDLKVLCIIQLERAATIFSYGGVFFREHFNAPAEGGVGFNQSTSICLLT